MKSVLYRQCELRRCNVTQVAFIPNYRRENYA